MTLREEIENKLDTHGISITNGYRVTDDMLALFKKWALEMLGEDLPDAGENEPDEPMRWAVNHQLHDIRQRIIASAEEETK